MEKYDFINIFMETINNVIFYSTFARNYENIYIIYIIITDIYNIYIYIYIYMYTQ